DGLTPARAGDEDLADRLPEMESAVRVTQAGDLWLLGRNQLVCGDALDDSTYSRLMDGRCSAAVFTDPLCNDVIDGCVTGLIKPRRSRCAMASGGMSEAEFTGCLSKALSHLVRNSEAGALHYICIDWHHIGELLAAAGRVYAEIENLCVWVQDTGRQGSLYRSQHELVLVFRNGKIKHSKNIQPGLDSRHRTNVWQYPRVNSSSIPTEEHNLSTINPAVKPVALVADAILDSTSRGQIVLDPFLGSGSTLIAAEQVGRVCYGIELNPIYCDVAIRRWQAFTGQTAVHRESGRSFGESAEVSYGRQP
ncbi:MAG: DNA methyltransferase, partial [Terriglobales bacterium]